MIAQRGRDPPRPLCPAPPDVGPPRRGPGARRGLLGRRRLHRAPPPRPRAGPGARGTHVAALHVAHGLRGEAGLADARFCADLTARLHVPYGFLSVDVPAQRNKGESVESAARRLRYRALLTVANEMGAVLLTGHTRDDQAETVLLHLERRLGRARGGIRASRPDGVVRPLLPFSRAELRTWLEAERRALARGRDERKRALRAQPRAARRAPGARAAHAGGDGAPRARRERRTPAVSTRSTDGSRRRWAKRRFL